MARGAVGRAKRAVGGAMEKELFVPGLEKLSCGPEAWQGGRRGDGRGLRTCAFIGRRNFSRFGGVRNGRVGHRRTGECAYP